MPRVIIPIRAVPKARARHTSINGIHRSYTPKTTAKFEQTIKHEIEKLKLKPSDKPISLSVTFTFKLPDSSPKYYSENINYIAHTVKPDLDNLLKSIKDAMNRVAWLDDAQVVDTLMSKFYGSDDYIVISWHETKNLVCPKGKRKDTVLAEIKNIQKKAINYE